MATSDLSSSFSLLGQVGQMQGKITCFPHEGCERFLLASEYATTFATFDMLTTS